MSGTGSSGTGLSGTESLGTESLSYEEAFSELESILARLEAGDLPLQESLALYEQAAALARACSTMLDEAEVRVRMWQPGDVTTPLDEWDED